MSDHGTQPILADGNVMPLDAGQRVAGQGEGRVRIAGGVGERGVQVAQLIEPLPLDPQPDPLNQLREPLAHIVDDLILDEMTGAETGLDATPRVAFAGAEQQGIVGTIRQYRAQGLDSFWPQGDNVVFIGLATAMVDDGVVNVHLPLVQFRAFHRSESAVEGEVDHGPQLDLATPRLRGGSGDLRGVGGEDGPNLIRGLQTPPHGRGGPAGELGDDPAQPHRATPSHIGGVAAGGAQVPDGTLAEVRFPILDEPIIDGPRVVRGQLIDPVMAGDGVDALRGELVLSEGVALQFPTFGVAAAVQQPAVQQAMEAEVGAGLDLHANLAEGLLAGDDCGGLAVVGCECGVGSALPANPPLASGDAGVVTPFADSQGEARGNGGGPRLGHDCSEKRYALTLRADDESAFLACQCGFSSPTLNVFPAFRAFSCAHVQAPVKQGISGTSDDSARSGDFGQKTGISGVDCYALIRAHFNGRGKRRGFHA